MEGVPLTDGSYMGGDEAVEMWEKAKAQAKEAIDNCKGFGLVYLEHERGMAQLGAIASDDAEVDAMMLYSFAQRQYAKSLKHAIMGSSPEARKRIMDMKDD